MGQMPTGKIPGDIKTASMGAVYGDSHKKYGVSNKELREGETSASKDSGGPGRFNEPRPAPSE